MVDRHCDLFNVTQKYPRGEGARPVVPITSATGERLRAHHIAATAISICASPTQGSESRRPLLENPLTQSQFDRLSAKPGPSIGLPSQDAMDEIQGSSAIEAKAEGPWSTLALETIGWKAFQDLCSQVCEGVLGGPVQVYREGIPANDPCFQTSTNRDHLNSRNEVQHSG